MPFNLKVGKTVVLAGTETVYGTAVVGVPMRAFGVTLNPQNGDDLAREDEQPFYGSREKIKTNMHSGLDLSIYIDGAGTAGGIPIYAPLLQGCGFAVTQNIGVDCIFTPVTGNEDSISLRCHYDKMNHLLTGSRGACIFKFNAGSYPSINFKYLGQYNAPTTSAPPGIDWSAWQKPKGVDCQNTPIVTIDGLAVPLINFELDQGGTVSADCIPNANGIFIEDRESKGTIEIYAPDDLATKDFFALALAGTAVPVVVEQGTVAGNIARIDAAKVQLFNPQYGERKRRRTLKFEAIYLPTVGNDEFTYTVK